MTMEKVPECQNGVKEKENKNNKQQNETSSEKAKVKTKNKNKGAESQKGVKKKETENNTQENEATLEKEKKKNAVKILKAQKKDKKKQKSPGVSDGSHIFALDEITNNKEASSLISDLVRCYTCNSNLPKEELDVLHKTLYEKTLTLFLHILNNCVEKIFNKLLSTDIFKEIFLSKKTDTKNAVCQTDVSYTDY